MSPQKTIAYGGSASERINFNTRNVSIIGGNGSGKSSLMRRIGLHNPNYILISAHKNLTIRQGAYRGNELDWLNQNSTHYEGPTSNGRIPSDNNTVQSDFNQMIELAFREYNDESVTAFNDGKNLADVERKLDNIFKLWNSIFVEKSILYKDKKIKVKTGTVGNEVYYDIENLSDGERVVLYVLLKLILSPDDATVVIDEPETFLNPAILNNLFDECEKLKINCSFMYFSHDLEFVTTRKDNTILWIKNYTYPNSWEIEPIDAQEIPDELIVKVVGAKKEKILFVEAEENKDAQLYQLIYPEFKVWPVGSCKNVIDYTKAFNLRTEKFNKDYFGLIDRDLRSTVEVDALALHHVFCLPVAIYENLFLDEDVIRFVFQYLGKPDVEARLSALKITVSNKVSEANFQTGYLKSRIQHQFNQELNSLIIPGAVFTPNTAMYSTELSNFATISYEEVLKIFNQKDLKGAVSDLGYTWQEWQTQVLNIFNTNEGPNLRTIFVGKLAEIN